MLLLLLLKESYSIDHCVWTRNKELSAVSRWTLLERRQRCRQEQSKNYKWIFLLSSFGCISSRSYYCVSVAIVYAACGDVSLRKTLNVTQRKSDSDFKHERFSETSCAVFFQAVEERTLSASKFHGRFCLGTTVLSKNVIKDITERWCQSWH